MTAAVAQPAPTSKPLIFARHLAGMSLVALANPLIWYSNDAVIRWISTWAVPVLIAGVAFGLFALFFTQRAKKAWPGRFFMLAWVLLALTLLGVWTSVTKPRTAPVAVQAPAVLPAPAPTHVPASKPNFFDQFDPPATSPK